MEARIGVVGAGAMAEAMVAGLLDRGVRAGNIVCSHPRTGRREQLATTLGVAVTASNPAAVDEADIVLLAVKPQVLPRVMAELAGALPAGALVVSIVAGASTQVLASGLAHAAVVRAMPNTPAQIGSGVTVWYGTKEVDPSGIATIRQLLAALGEEFQVEEESLVTMATAVSGTGPIGSQGRGVGAADPSPHSPFDPCVRFSRTRLTDGLLGMVTLPPDSGWCPANGTDLGPETSRPSIRRPDLT